MCSHAMLILLFFLIGSQRLSSLCQERHFSTIGDDWKQTYKEHLSLQTFLDKLLNVQLHLCAAPSEVCEESAFRVPSRPRRRKEGDSFHVSQKLKEMLIQ